MFTFEESVKSEEKLRKYSVMIAFCMNSQPVRSYRRWAGQMI
jgi:hypothetical protein